MKKTMKRILSFILCLAMFFTMLPTSALAAESNPEKLEIDDGYLKVTVSGKNGGFLIDTVKGNKLDKADDNKNLLFPAADFDTSYTSFQVTRKNGTMEEYIFGRKYGFLGLATRDVVLTREGNAIVATWGVRDLTVKQTLTLLDETASLHGMVNISYTVSTTGDDIDNVKMRVMYDTALGFQDYAIYEVPNRLNEYTHVIKDTVIDNSGENEGDYYSGTLFAVDNEKSPTITAYTVDATLEGETISPYQMAFGHWNNLASSVFDFVPKGITFTNAYNQEYMTADSAYAMYYDLGAIGQNEEKSFATYYGVYSNATLRDEETVAINFPVLPAPMELKGGSSSAYVSQVENGADGDIHLKMMLENISGETYEKVTVVVEPMNKVYPYEDYLYYPDVRGEEGEPIIEVIDDFKYGEEVIIDSYFNVEPLIVSEYRRFKVLVYNTTNGDELTDARLVGSREFYLFCPGELGETIVFNNMDPDVIYYEGTRDIYVSGLNFALLKDTTAYTAVLHSLSGGSDVVVPGTNVVVDTNSGTVNLVVDETMEIGTYQVIFDWIDPGKEDATSDLLRFQVTDDLSKVSSTYGVVTVEKAEDYTDDNPTYAIGLYRSEEAYQEAIKNKTWDQRPYLEFRGNFGVRRENGQIVEVRANSLTDIFGNPLSTINISNCLDVECGMVALRVENPGEDDQVINIDIDGKVYTTNARTSVWDGVCAITSFTNGDMSTMLEYNYEGVVQGDIENSVANTNGITLLWPGAASTMQTIAGMFFEFNYCQFGYMALEQGTVTPETDRMRIISFGAELSPDFLIPSNYDWGGRQTSAMDVAQMTLAKQNYTSDQLRNLQDRFAQDQQAFLDAQRGSLSLYVTDILFGGGFAGFNTTIEVETPEYGDVLPSLNGTLSLKVLPATMYRDGRIWEFGIAGSTELMMIHVEGSFGLKETPAGVPAIDKFYCFADGGVPGINLDGVGVFWLTGVGGGMSNIYNSMFVVSKVPPMALTIAAGFRLFQIMSAKASVKASLRGFDAAMTNIGIAGVDLIDKIGFSLYWYPELKLRGDMYLDILGIISAGGYIVVEENQETGDIFWEAFANGSVQTPNIGIIPGIEVGSVDLGVNASKVWGALHVLKLDMGVTYYWGGDVNFAFGKYDAPESTYPLGVMAVGEDPATGRVLYMSLGTNAILSASSDKEITRTLNEKKLANTRASLEPSIESTADNMTHIIDLGAYEAGRDILLNITFKAETKQDAEWIAKGNGLTAKGISLTTEDGSATYPLVWLDNSKPADEQPDANALFAYNENTKTGTISISFTEESFYDTLWKLNSDVETTLALYHLNKLPGLDSVSYTYAEQSNIVTITDLAGYELNTIGEVDVYAVDTENQQYFLGTVSAADPDARGLKLPVDLPSGTYTIRVVANNDSENICSTADAADSFTFVNALQPEDPKISSIGLGGDYTLDVDVVSGSKPIDGYRTTIYEKDGDQWIAVEDFSNVIVEADADNQSGSLTLGGSYTTMNYVDDQGNLLTYAEAQENSSATMVETIHALEDGKTYRVGISTYQNDPSGLPVYSREVISDEVTMVAPDPAEVTVQAVGAKAIGSVIDPNGSTIDVVTNAQVSFQIRSDMEVSGSWSLDGGVQTGIWNAANSGTITLAEDVAEGEHMLTLTGENAAGDGFQVQYRFRVDCSGPALQISAPVNGQVFGRSDNDYAKETVHVVGLSEPGTTVIVALEGTETAKITVDETGSFSIPVVLDETKLDQTLTVYGVDAAGNQSAVKSFHLNNAITGAEGLYLAIYLNGQDVTNEILPAGSMGDVELRFVAGDQSVVIPETSEIGRQIEWDMSVLDGTITLEDDQLFTDPSAHGLLQANYGLMNATVVFGEEDLEEDNQITFAVADGYTLHTDESMMVPYGQDFHFTVEIAEGYTATEDFAVMANGVVLTADNGVYTIAEVYAPKYVEVVGVADITAPTASVTVVDNTWRDFLNTISFGIFFKESQTATITAQDNGSGVKEVFYYISETQLTLDQVKDIETWAAYTGSFTLDPDRSAVIYVKAVDHAGNIVYISSDGMVFDATAPVITNIQDGGSYYGDQTFQVVEKYLDTLKVDGQVVTLTDGSFVIPADNEEHIIELTDKAGNQARYTITVYKIYTVTFEADGQIVDTVEVNHGAGLAGTEFPEIPAKVGYDQTAPAWTVAGQTVTELTNVTDDMTVTAAYTINIYAVTLPGEMIGYTIVCDETTGIEHGSQFTFRVEIAEGYVTAAEFAVYVNGEKVTAESGVYTVVMTGDISITVEGVKDATAPTGEIAVVNHRWKEFLNTITFGIFFKESQTVTITAADAGSGVNAIYYYLTDQILTEEEVEEIEGWITYNNGFTLNPDNNYVVYAKLVDNAGNICYINSDGMVLDATVPVIDGIQNGASYYGDQTFTVIEEYLDTVKVDEQDVTLTEGKFVIPADNEEHTIVLTDKAGNVTEYTITVYKIYTVTFVADGQTVDTVNVNHGAGMAAGTLPQIPAKVGYDQTAPVWTVNGQTVTELINVTSDMTVTAAYTINTYIVTFVADGQTVGTVTVEHGRDVLAAEFPEIPAKTGYDQTAPVWTVNGQTVTELTNVTGDVTVTAVYTINTYTVTFVADGQTVGTVTVEHGSDVLAAAFPEIPAKEGADEFEPVWTVNGQTVTELTNVTGDIIVTARYQANVYIVTFMADGNMVGTVEVEHGGSVLASQFPEIPGKTGYDQTAPVWTVDDQTVTELTNVTGDMTVTAAYTINTYTVTFTADGQTVGTVEVEHGGSVLASQFPEIPGKTGYDQAAPVWTVDDQIVTELTNVIGDMTVTAAYTINTYTVTFVADGQTVDTVIVEHGSDVPETQFPEIPAKEGYDQSAPVWTVEGQTVTELTNVTGDMTVTADYTINTYIVTFVADGQTVGTVTVEHGGDVLASQFPEIPAKDGADEFEPVWTVNGQAVTELTKVTGDVIVTARYQTNVYTVTFMADGNMVGTVEVEHGSDVLAAQFPEIPAKEGYDQTAPAWTVEGQTVTELTNVTGDVTVTAAYTINTYTVTFVIDGETVDTVEVEYGSDVLATEFPEIPAKTGYDQTAPVWTVDGQIVTELTNVTGDVTVTAAYTINTYTVTFVADGQMVGTVTVEHGSDVLAAQFPEIPAKTGYDQTAPVWTVDGQTVTELTNVTDDVTVTAVYTINTYTVTFVADGQMVGTVTVEHGSDVLAAEFPEIPAKTGYDQTAPVWTVDGEVVTELTNVISDITVTAVYTINTYTVTFVADDQMVGTVEVEHGSSVSGTQFPEIPAKAGYDQTAPVWTVEGQIVTELTNVTGDVTVTAAYTINTYTVTFVADGQTVGTVEVEHGSSVSGAQFPEIPAKVGYDQTAPVWAVEGQTVTELANVTADVTVTAVYTINTYDVTLPADMIGYTITGGTTTDLEHGSAYTFRITVADGYTATEDFAVYANGVKLTAEGSSYAVVMTEDVIITVEGIKDVTAPELTVTVETNIWREFLNTITFGLFFKETQEAELTATDLGSGIHGMYYLISSHAIALDDLANAGWTQYTGKVKLDADGHYVVYAKAVDNAGNVTYVNSNGLVIDTIAPSVEGIVDGGVYEGEVTFTVTDENIDTVTINGTPVNEMVVTLSPAEEPYTIVITDKAGNETRLTITVNEKQEEPPVCDGGEDCPGHGFADLDPDAWYHEGVDFVLENGLMNGYPDQTFGPEDILTRSMFVQVLYNLEGRPAVSGQDAYTDTVEGAWYTDAVLWASQNGIVNGYGNGLFGPDDAVSREQMATMFYRYSQLKGYSLTEGNYDHFPDKADVSQFAETAMRWAVGNGLLMGMGDGTLAPLDDSTRVEFVTLIQRFVETIVE